MEHHALSMLLAERHLSFTELTSTSEQTVHKGELTETGTKAQIFHRKQSSFQIE